MDPRLTRKSEPSPCATSVFFSSNSISVSIPFPLAAARRTLRADDKRTFLFKFSRSGGATESGEGEKVTVLMESGARFHSTSFTRERKADAPSKFNMKLRMHLRSKRLNAVTQYGAGGH